MSTNVYRSPKKRLSGGLAVLSAAILVGGLFLAIPLSQLLDDTIERSARPDTIEFADAPPPPPMETPPPPEQVEEAVPEEAPIEMAQEAATSLDLGMAQTNVLGGIGGARVTASANFTVKASAGMDAFSTDDLDQHPTPVSQTAPKFPKNLKERKVAKGQVVVMFVVDESGSVLSPKVQKSTNSGFNEAALSAVRKWRFKPGMKDGKKVKSKVLCPINFQLA
jgi:protein TonB